jgi:hypothetical protein
VGSEGSGRRPAADVLRALRLRKPSGTGHTLAVLVHVKFADGRGVHCASHSDSGTPRNSFCTHFVPSHTYFFGGGAARTSPGACGDGRTVAAAAASRHTSGSMLGVVMW